MALALSIITTCAALAGGTATATGTGSDTVLTVANDGVGDWAADDTFTVIFTDAQTGAQVQVGAGNVTGLVTTFGLTFNDKIYLLGGTGMYFSGITAPTKFNDPTVAGNGYIKMGNQNGTPENMVALATYQGFMAIIARRTTQTWAIDPDPTQNARQQILPNIGTMAPLSVQNIGDRELLMLADSGVRSLRPRVASLNADVIDIGTPVDSLVQTALLALSETEKAASCAVTEPSANRYMVYIPGPGGAIGKIYVFSSFPASQIEAWTTYTPSYQVSITAAAKVFPVTAGKVYAWKPAAAGDTLACGSVALVKQGIFTAPVGATSATVTGSAAGTLSRTDYFAPEKFSTLLARVYCRAGDNVFIYGGTDNNTYDVCGPHGQLPFLDCDTPTINKKFNGIDVALEGDWLIAPGINYDTKVYSTPVYRSNKSSFLGQRIPMAVSGTHISLDFQELSDGYARLSSALIHFEQGQVKA